MERFADGKAATRLIRKAKTDQKTKNAFITPALLSSTREARDIAVANDGY